MLASLVMPSYGQHQHIYDAVRSVLLQDIDAVYELKIVFGGPEKQSVDEVRRALESYDGSCVVDWTHTERNTCAGDAINLGFAQCNDTPYWAWLSSDNVLASSWLVEMSSHLERYPEVDAVYSSYTRETGVVTGRDWHATSKQTVRPANVGLAKDSNCYIGPSHLHRSELWEKVGKHVEDHAHDYDWWLRAEEVGTIAHLDKVLATLRKHPDRANVRMNRDGARDGERWRQAAIRRRA